MQFRYPILDAMQSNYSLFISKVPTITIDSGFAWDTFLATIIGSFIAGTIPAYIAWKTIRSNVDTLKLQIKINERSKSRELVKDLCAQYCADVEVMLTEISMDIDRADKSSNYGSEHAHAIALKHFQSARAMNLYTNKIILNINEHNPHSSDIERCFKDFEKLANKYFEPKLSSEDSDNLSQELLICISNFLRVVREYIKKEYDYDMD